MLVAISSRQQVQAEVAVPEMRKERHLEGGLGPDARVDEQEPLLHEIRLGGPAVDPDVRVRIVEFEIAQRG